MLWNGCFTHILSKGVTALFFSNCFKQQVLRSLAPGITIECKPLFAGEYIFCWAMQNGSANGIPPTWQPPGGRLFFYICKYTECTSAAQFSPPAKLLSVHTFVGEIHFSTGPCKMAAPAWLHPIWQPPGGKWFDEICKYFCNVDEIDLSFD